MIRSFILAALLLFVMPAMAQNISAEGLNDAQVAAIKAETARLAAENAANKNDPGTVFSNAAGWGKQASEAAEGFARALGIAARELNVTINEFLTSPAGKLTAVMIVWKIAGSSILSLFYGLLFVVVGLSVVRMIYLRLFTDRYEVVEYKRFWGLWQGKKTLRITRSVKDLRGEGEWLLLYVLMVATAGVLGIGGAIIF